MQFNCNNEKQAAYVAFSGQINLSNKTRFHVMCINVRTARAWLQILCRYLFKNMINKSYQIKRRKHEAMCTVHYGKGKYLNELAHSAVVYPDYFPGTVHAWNTAYYYTLLPRHVTTRGGKHRLPAAQLIIPVIHGLRNILRVTCTNLIASDAVEEVTYSWQAACTKVLD